MIDFEKSSNFKIKYSIFLIWFGLVLTTFTIIFSFLIPLLKEKINSTLQHKVPDNKHQLWYPTGAIASLWRTISYFSVQSDIIVFVFFIFSLYNLVVNNKKTPPITMFGLATTLYISITMIIYFITLFKPKLDQVIKSNYSTIAIFDIINSLAMHLGVPLIMINYYLINAGSEKWAIKKTLKCEFLYIIGYMFLYLGYALLKGTFVGQLQAENDSLKVTHSYPYDFLDISNKIKQFIYYFIIILGLFLGLFASLFFYNNHKYSTKIKKEEYDFIQINKIKQTR